jgi:hypothetical protein
MMVSPSSRPSGVVLAVGLLLGLIGTGPGQAQPAAKTVSDTVALDPSGTVEIDNHRGSITVTTWNRTEVKYEVRIASPNEQDDLPFTTLDATHSDEELELDADFPWRIQIPGVVTISPGGSERAAFHYTVSVPESARLEIDDYASAIQVADVKGDVVIDTYSGTVKASNLAGSFALEMYGGTAQVSFSALTAPLSVDTYAGPVHLSLPMEAGFDLKTDLQSADQLTVDGSLSLPSPTEDGNYDGPVNGGGPKLSIESYSSTITLRTP